MLKRLGKHARRDFVNRTIAYIPASRMAIVRYACAVPSGERSVLHLSILENDVDAMRFYMKALAWPSCTFFTSIFFNNKMSDNPVWCDLPFLYELWQSNHRYSNGDLLYVLIYYDRRKFFEYTFEREPSNFFPELIGHTEMLRCMKTCLEKDCQWFFEWTKKNWHDEWVALAWGTLHDLMISSNHFYHYPPSVQSKCISWLIRCVPCPSSIKLTPLMSILARVLCLHTALDISKYHIILLITHVMVKNPSRRLMDETTCSFLIARTADPYVGQVLRNLDPKCCEYTHVKQHHMNHARDWLAYPMSFTTK